MIGNLVLRTAEHAIAIGALDLELPASDGEEGARSRWRVKIVLLSEGMRVESTAMLAEEELPALGAELEELVAGRRTRASLASQDGSLYLALEARSESELGIALRILRDRERGVISVVESRIARAHAADVAGAARRFPY